MKITRLATAILFCAAALSTAPSACAASNNAAVTETIGRAIAAFNRGDMKAWAAACASPASVIDDFPPHEWNGRTACADWAADYDALAKKTGMADGVVALGPPWHLAVTGQRAYAVYPAAFTYKQHGKLVKDGGVFTFALDKTAAGWLITGWAWSDH